jgi:hypothetical protein
MEIPVLHLCSSGYSKVKNRLKRLVVSWLTFGDTSFPQKEVLTIKPCNFKPEYSSVFSNVNLFQGHVPQKITFRNVYLLWSGIVCKRFKVSLNSIHSFYDDHVWHCIKYMLGYYMFRNTIKMPNQNYMAIHNFWSTGYYHWLAECIPRLWAMRHECSSFVLLLPDTYKGFQLSSLEPFHFKEIVFFPTKKKLFIDQLTIPSNPSSCEQYVQVFLHEIRSFYHSYLEEKKNIHVNLGSRIYISRAKAQSRKIENEAEVIEVLHGLGFQMVNFEDFSFWEQVSIMKNCQYLVSIHGAGLTNCQFMPASGSILEFQKKKTKEEDFYSSVYFTLSQKLGLNYYYQFCEPGNPMQSIFEANIIVDISELKENLILMLSNANR